eukprot:PhF_6_TR43674/c0_g1_i1/m.67116/K15382/SLC50A, SWEET; solute carrier family 50 (sugar transporter)
MSLLVDCLAFLSMILTIGMFSYPLRAAREMTANQTIGNTNPALYSAMLVNCLLWTAYGVITDKITIVICNAVGIVVSSYTLAVFMLLAMQATRPYIAVVTTVLGLSFVLLHETRNDESFVDYLGILGNIASCVMFASPLSGLRAVVASGRADSIPIGQVWLNTCTALSWCLYGIATSQGYVVAPNGIGLLLCAVQIGLYIRYKTDPNE